MELERLIETEQRNDALVRRAREEADAIVHAAHERAAQREAAFKAAVQQLIHDNEVALDAERERRVAEIGTQARAAVEKYDAVSDNEIVRIVPLLVDHLLAQGATA